MCVRIDICAALTYCVGIKAVFLWDDNSGVGGVKVEIRLIVDCGAAYKNTCCKDSRFSIVKKSKKPIRSSSPFDRVFCKNKTNRNATQN